FVANETSSRAVRTASRTSAATIVRCRPVTGSPYGVGADLAERTETTAICSGRRLELTGANPVGDGNDLGLGPFEATITGIAATDEPGLEEMQRQLMRGLPVLPLPRERVDAELERLARPTGGGARIAHITRFVVGDRHAAVRVHVDAVVASADAVAPQYHREFLFHRGRTRWIGLLLVPEAGKCIARSSLPRFVVLASEKADRLPVRIELGVEVVQGHRLLAHLVSMEGLHRSVECAPIRHLVAGRRRDPDQVCVPVASGALQVVVDLAKAQRKLAIPER